MANHSSKSMFHYEIDPLIKPGPNMGVWVWLGLLGIPALALMLIYSKIEERNEPQAKPTTQLNRPVQPLQLQSPQHAE